MLIVLERTLPLLIRLGDFVGNGEERPPIGYEPYDRCAVVLAVREAIENLRKELPLCDCGRDIVMGLATMKCPACWPGYVRSRDPAFEEDW